MFMVKCKYFADANITNILNIRKFFEIFFKKNSPSPPSFINFCYQGKGASKSTSQRVNKPTSQRVEVRRVRQVRQVRQEMGLKGPKGLPGPKTKHPHHPHQPQNLLTR